MWINYPGPLPAGGVGSTMMFTTGVGTSGTLAQFPGTSVEGVLFAVDGDGGTTLDYRAYTNVGAPLNGASGVYAAGTTDAAQSQSDPYYKVFGGRTAPEAQVALYPGQTGATSSGAVGFARHEVAITKVGQVVSRANDKVTIATVDAGEKQLGSDIFLGYFDITAGLSENHDLSFGLVDNLRVEQLSTTSEPPTINITATSVANGSITVRFTATSGAASDFTLVGSATVDGDYTDSSAAITSVGDGVFEATVAAAGPQQFFQVKYH
jgi:hypothetical protein